jgi:hypothetical protein
MIDRMATVHVPSTGHILGAIAHPRAELPITVDVLAPNGIWVRNVRPADAMPASYALGGDGFIHFGVAFFAPDIGPYTLARGDEVFFVEPQSLDAKAVDYNAGLFAAPLGYVVGANEVRQLDPNPNRTFNIVDDSGILFDPNLGLPFPRPLRAGVRLTRSTLILSLPRQYDADINCWVQIEPKGALSVEQPLRRVVSAVIPAHTKADTAVTVPLQGSAGGSAALLPAGDYWMLVLIDGFLPDARTQTLA